MYIEECKEEDGGVSGTNIGEGVDSTEGGNFLTDSVSRRRVLVGVGARFLFYPTLLYNVVRNRTEPAFHWWDEVDEFVLLGAVPFPSDVPYFKEIGVHGVVTLNEPYETLVPVSLYLANGIKNLVIPTRDYLFAPSFGNICQAVDFIHRNASHGKTTYVHCKAGRGRSTTVVLCYLVQHRQMTPTAAYQYVRLRRPRVRLAASQWQAVQDYYCLRVLKTGRLYCLDNPFIKIPDFIVTRNFLVYDDSSFVVISNADLDGYDNRKSVVRNNFFVELSLAWRMQLSGQVAHARLSHFWFRHRRSSKQNALLDEHRKEACSVEVGKPQFDSPCLQMEMAV